MIVQLEWSVLYFYKKYNKKFLVFSQENYFIYFCLKYLLPKQGIYQFLVWLYIKNAGGECQPSNHPFGGSDLPLTMDFPQHTPVVRKGKIQSLGKEI